MRRTIGLVIAQRRIGPADEHRKIPTLGPGARPDRITLPALDGEVTRLEIYEQGGGWIERPEQGSFANSTASEDAALDAALFRQTLVGAYDREAH